MSEVATDTVAVAADPRANPTRMLNATLVLLLVGFGALSIAVGANVMLNPLTVLSVILEPDKHDRLEVLSANLRVPRMLLAALVGGALAVSGALLQSIYRNPLADPGLTGVTGGAIAFVGIFRIFGPQVDVAWVGISAPIIAVCGGLVAAGITWFFASLAGRNQAINLILIGVLVGGFFASAMTIAFLWAPNFEMLHSLLSWFVGSFYRATWSDLAIVAVGLLLTMPMLLAAIPRANLLQLGDSVAQGLGARVQQARAVVLITSCLLAGFAVCTVGGVGFVGLMAPHMVRWFVGTDLRRLVPTVAMLGALLVVATDLFARTFNTGILTEWFGLPVNPQALPVGLFLNLLGGVFFLFLLRRLRG